MLGGLFPWKKKFGGLVFEERRGERKGRTEAERLNFWGGLFFAGSKMGDWEMGGEEKKTTFRLLSSGRPIFPLFLEV